MDAIDQFLRLVDEYVRATGLRDGTVSTRLFNDGKRLAGLRGGGTDMGVRRLSDAIAWLASHWPESAIWPADIPRPDFTPALVDGPAGTRAAGSSPGPAAQPGRAA